RPNQKTYAALVASAKNANRAVKWLQQAQVENAESQEAYNAALGALAREERHKEVQLMCANVTCASRPDIVTYNSILVNCVRNADDAGVTLWLKRMKEAGFSPDLVTFNTLVELHARRGQVKMAFQWIQHLKAAGYSPTVRSYTPVVLALSRACDTKGAVACLRQMRDDGVMPNTVTFSAVLDTFVVKRDARGADSFLSRLASSECHLDARIFDQVVRLCNKEGEHCLAVKWFKQLRQVGQPTGACASAACASWAALGEAAEAAALMRKAEAEKMALKVRAFSNLAKAWAAQGRILSAVHTINKMYRAGHRCAPMTWAIILAACRSMTIKRRGEAEVLLLCMAEHEAPIPG
ncbi:Pentatricopeptide repeat-containing protein At3g48810, partial [Durusdinium trenchii]